MFPTLKSGQTFVGLKTKKIGVGDVVIVKAHGSVDMVKRVASIEGAVSYTHLTLPTINWV